MGIGSSGYVRLLIKDYVVFAVMFVVFRVTTDAGMLVLTGGRTTG